MQLTRHTDYGLRILIYLALLPEGRLASVDEISAAYDVSRNNLNKIVHKLGKEGYIETKRGKGGGFSLKLAPEDINIGAVVLLLENTMKVVDCESPTCRILPACKLQSILNEATHSFVKTLQGYTLQDLLQGRSDKLITVLDLE